MYIYFLNISDAQNSLNNWQLNVSSFHSSGNAPEKGLDRRMNTIFHSKGGTDEWYQIDFGLEEIIYGTEFILRGPLSMFNIFRDSRFKNIEVRVSSNEDVSIKERELCHKQDRLISSLVVWLPCYEPIKGRFLSVMNIGNNILEFTEIFVVVERGIE